MLGISVCFMMENQLGMCIVMHTSRDYYCKSICMYLSLQKKQTIYSILFHRGLGNAYYGELKPKKCIDSYNNERRRYFNLVNLIKRKLSMQPKRMMSSTRLSRYNQNHTSERP